MKNPNIAKNLKSDLLSKFQWYEERLIEKLASRGEVRLTVAQNRVMSLLSTRQLNIADIARNLGISRQAAHKTVSKLIELGLLTASASKETNESLILFTDHGERVKDKVQKIMQEIEAGIAQSIGQEKYEMILDILDADWDAQKKEADQQT